MQWSVIRRQKVGTRRGGGVLRVESLELDAESTFASAATLREVYSCRAVATQGSCVPRYWSAKVFSNLNVDQASLLFVNSSASLQSLTSASIHYIEPYHGDIETASFKAQAQGLQRSLNVAQLLIWWMLSEMYAGTYADPFSTSVA